MNKDFFEDEFDEEDDTEEQPKKEKTLTKGFLVALGVCLAAIGTAVWTTVNSVNSYLSPTVAVYESSDRASDSSAADIEQRVNAAVSAPAADTDSDTDNNKPVRFVCEPIKNKKLIAPYSETPVYNETLGDYRAHTGLDYAADIDDKVRAMGQGVVKDIYYDDLLGNVVEIEHSDSVCSYYCGLAKTTLVQKGDVISAGDFVGTVYAIPGEAAESAHVHVAVKENGRWVDPRKFMSKPG